MTVNRLTGFLIYETRRLLILIGRDGDTNRIIEVKRDAGCQLILNEDYTKAYSTEKLMEYLRRMKASLLHDRVYCFFGFVRLHESYYLIAVTNASVVANIHGHDIYSVMGTSMIPITYMPRKTVEETKYRALLNSVDLTNCCYFSYTYDLTSSMQRQEQFQSYEKSVQDMFVWNKSAIEPLEYLEKECLAAGMKRPHTWVTHILHGSLQQKSADFRGARGNHTKLHEEDTHHLRLLTYTLIARRSRHFAGARYLRRGVNAEGYVANEVETEQIVTACMEEISEEGTSKADSGVGPAPENYQYAEPATPAHHVYRSSSMVQVRGSIPLYWHHINLLSPAPDIVTEKMPPASLPAHMALDIPEGGKKAGSDGVVVTYPASRAHFKRLYERYGAHVDVLNLVKLHHSKREVTIGMAFVQLCNALNGRLQLTFQGVAPKKDKDKTAADVEQAAHAGEPSSSEDEATDEEGDGEGEKEGGDGGIVTWNDSPPHRRHRHRHHHHHHHNHRRDKNGSDSYSPLEEDEGDVEGCVEEEDYSLTYHVFDLLHFHEAEHSHHHHSNSSRPKGSHSLVHVQPPADGDDSKGAGVVTSESDPPPASADVFEKLSEITSEFQQRSGFFVQAPRTEGAASASRAVSFPLKEGDDEAIGLSRRSFLQPDDGEGSIAGAAGGHPSQSHATNESQQKESGGTAGAGPGSESEGEGKNKHVEEDEDHDHELVWRDVTVEDITSWISDGRLRTGATCQVRQHGVLRTNCIDCLDRTNIAQFVHAKESILRQCRALGVCLTPTGLNHVLQMTTDLWTRHGNDLAVQYGGSGAMHSLAFVDSSADGDSAPPSSSASSSSSSSSSSSLSKGIQHSLSNTSLAMMKDTAKAKGKDLKKFLLGVSGHIDKEEEKEEKEDNAGTQREKNEEAEAPETEAREAEAKEEAEAELEHERDSQPRFKLTGGLKNGLVAVNRYYANITSDYDKQLAMDLILGLFVPSKERPAIWEFDLQPQFHRTVSGRYQVAKQELGEGGEEEGAKGHFDPLMLIGKGIIW